MQAIIIYGASGHARVIIDIIEQAAQFKIAGLIDNTGSVTNLMGYPVATDIAAFCDHGIRSGIIAVGDNWQRSQLAAKVMEKYSDFKFVTCVHPSARIGRNVVIGDGSVVMAGCNVNPQVLIKSHCIINTGANVDHDCTIGEYASIAPGATLGGSVTIGDYSAVGLGSSVIQKIGIGSHVVIGAGSVVVKNITSHCIAYGNPCRVVKSRAVGSSYL